MCVSDNVDAYCLLQWNGRKKEKKGKRKESKIERVRNGINRERMEAIMFMLIISFKGRKGKERKGINGIKKEMGKCNGEPDMCGFDCWIFYTFFL